MSLPPIQDFNAITLAEGFASPTAGDKGSSNKPSPKTSSFGPPHPFTSPSDAVTPRPTAATVPAGREAAIFDLDGSGMLRLAHKVKFVAATSPLQRAQHKLQKWQGERGPMDKVARLTERVVNHPGATMNPNPTLSALRDFSVPMGGHQVDVSASLSDSGLEIEGAWGFHARTPEDRTDPPVTPSISAGTPAYLALQGAAASTGLAPQDYLADVGGKGHEVRRALDNDALFLVRREINGQTHQLQIGVDRHGHVVRFRPASAFENELAARPLLEHLTDKWYLSTEYGGKLAYADAPRLQADTRKVLVCKAGGRDSIQVLARANRLNNPWPAAQPPWQPRATLAEKVAWLQDSGKSVPAHATEAAVDELLRGAANDVLKVNLMLGNSTVHRDAKLYDNVFDPSRPLLIQTDRFGALQQVDLPTPFERMLTVELDTLADYYFHLHDAGLVTFNSTGRNEYEPKSGVLHLDPGNAQGLKAARAALEQAVDDLRAELTPDDFESVRSGQGTEKEMYLMKPRHDAVVLVQKFSNTQTEGKLRRGHVQAELEALKTLEALGFPVPTVEQVALVHHHDDEYHWGLMEVYYEDAQISKLKDDQLTFLNENSVQELEAIDRRFRELGLGLRDPQLLGCKAGHVRLVDPKGLRPGPDTTTAALLQRLIGIAKDNVAKARAAADVAPSPDTTPQASTSKTT